MLYYTFAAGATKGIFSGRFVFKIHGAEDGEATLLVDHVESSSLKEFGTVLTHEKAHHFASRYAPLGTYLVGLRFIARLAFAFGRNDWVESYYRKRTGYFALTYSFHEALIDRLVRLSHKGGMDQINVSEAKISAIRKLDRRLVRSPFINLYPLLPLFFHPLYRIGAMVTKEFAVIFSDQSRPGNAKLLEATTRAGNAGIFNAAFQPSKRDGPIVRLIKFARRATNIEGLSRFLGGKFVDDRILLWSQLKLQAEFDAVCDLFQAVPPHKHYEKFEILRRRATKGSLSPDEYFKKYLTTILPFALKYSGRTPIYIHEEIHYLIEEIVRSVKSRDFSSLSAAQAKLLSEAGGLFFYHGN